MSRRRTRGGHGGGGGGHDSAGGLRWLLTYADMITLLMAFFIMMYAISFLDLKKFDALSKTLHEIFGGGKPTATTSGQGLLERGTPDGQRPVMVPFIVDTPPEMHEIEEGIERIIEHAHLTGRVLVWREERGLVVSLPTDGVFFARGSAELNEGTAKTLLTIASLLRRSNKPIRVEGHTCDLPIRTARFPSNWELSTGRAVAVARFLMERSHIAPSQLAVAGYAEQRPLFINTSEENRRMNRRVDLVLLTGAEARSEPRRDVGAGGRRS